MNKSIMYLAAACALAVWSRAADSKPDANGQVTLKGEVLDMACYLDHGAHGAKHAACAEKCIRSGLPVGLKAEDGQVYLLIGEHKPLNDVLADYAAKTVTVRGKVATRDGINLLEDAAIVP